MVEHEINPDSVCEVLKQEGFRLEKIQDDNNEAEALFYKPRAGGAGIYVTVPINVDCLLEEAVHKIMQSAGVPVEKYKHLLNPE